MSLPRSRPFGYLLVPDGLQILLHLLDLLIKVETLSRVPASRARVDGTDGLVVRVLAGLVRRQWRLEVRYVGMVDAVDGDLPVNRLLQRSEAVLELLEEVVAQVFLGRHRSVGRGQVSCGRSKQVLEHGERGV